MMISESYRWFLCCFTLDISSCLCKITWFISLPSYISSHFLHQRQNWWSRHYFTCTITFLFCSQWFQLLSLSGPINDFFWKAKYPLYKKKATLNPPKIQIAIIPIHSLIAENHHVWEKKRADVTFCNLHLRLSLPIITFNYNFEQDSNTTIYLTITGLAFVISFMTKIKITLQFKLNPKDDTTFRTKQFIVRTACWLCQYHNHCILI